MGGKDSDRSSGDGGHAEPEGLVSEEEFEEDPALETFIDVLVSGVSKEGIKKALIWFIRAREAHVSMTAEAKQETIAILRCATQGKKSMNASADG